jgi:hypothetical protein
MLAMFLLLLLLLSSLCSALLIGEESHLEKTIIYSMMFFISIFCVQEKIGMDNYIGTPVSHPSAEDQWREKMYRR